MKLAVPVVGGVVDGFSVGEEVVSVDGASGDSGSLCLTWREKLLILPTIDSVTG